MITTRLILISTLVMALLAAVGASALGFDQHAPVLVASNAWG